MVDIKKVRVMPQNSILLYNTSKLTGTEGFLNYKMSGCGSGNQNKNGRGSTGGGFAIIIIVSIIYILLKACGE